MLSARLQAQFTFTTNNNTITITGYTGSNGDVVVPEFIFVPVLNEQLVPPQILLIPFQVTSIGNWSFYATGVTNVLIPDTVTNIGDGAFFDCQSLTNVTAGSSLTRIGNWAFAFCPSLTSVCCRGNVPGLGGSDGFYGNAATIYYLTGTTGWGSTFDGHPAVLWNPPVQFTYVTNSDGSTLTITAYTGSEGAVSIPDTINFLPVTDIGTQAFYPCMRIPCTYVTNVVIPSSVRNIESEAFNFCTGLISVTIPDSVTNIGDDAFYNCTGLTSVTIPKSVDTIGFGVFAWCTSLSSITVPDSVTSIGVDAFAGCSSLTNIAILDSVSSIGDLAFNQCGSLSNINIPGGVTNIGNLVFRNCFNLKAITVDLRNAFFSSVNGVLFNKSQTILLACPGGQTGSYTIPNGVTSIGEDAFYNCIGLSNIIIPNSVTNIGDEAFESCTGLTRITIPNSVVNLVNGAFEACTSLTTITIPDSVTNIGDVAFGYCTSLSSVYFLGNAPAVDPEAFRAISCIHCPPAFDSAIAYYLPGTTGWSSTIGGIPAVLWNPQIQIGDGGFGVKTNRFGFNITGNTNIPIVVEAAPNLNGATWALLQNCALTNGSIYFSDPAWTNYPSRFYHIRSP